MHVSTQTRTMASVISPCVQMLWSTHGEYISLPSMRWKTNETFQIVPFLFIFVFLRADKPVSLMTSLIREMLLLLLVYFRIDDGYSTASSWGLTQIIGCLPAVYNPLCKNNLHKGLAGRPGACVLDAFLVWAFVCACVRKCMMHSLSTAIDP